MLASTFAKVMFPEWKGIAIAYEKSIVLPTMFGPVERFRQSFVNPFTPSGTVYVLSLQPVQKTPAHIKENNTV